MILTSVLKSIREGPKSDMWRKTGSKESEKGGKDNYTVIK